MKRKRSSAATKSDVSHVPPPPGALLEVETKSERGRHPLRRLLGNAISTKEFFDKFWQQTYLRVSHKNPQKFRTWFNERSLRVAIRKTGVTYGYELDVTKYADEERFTLNGPMGSKAKYREVNGLFESGCSIRLLRPQEHSNRLWRRLAELESFFSDQVGANVYYTPANSQGFSPHYDDIEAFVLQVSGRKRWLLRGFVSPEQMLARYSSRNFRREELSPDVTEIILEPGDVLYFPRGYVHEANTLGMDEHSMHITVSMGHRNTWYDYMKLAIPRALDLACESVVGLRRNMPLHYDKYMGLIHSESDDAEKEGKRDAFKQIAEKLVHRVVDFLPLDSAADQMQADMMDIRLPPPVNTPVSLTKTFTPQSAVRLRDASLCRLASVDDGLVLYHPMNNTRGYTTPGDVERFSVPFPVECGPALEHLILSFPSWTLVRDLPAEEEALQLRIVEELAQVNLVQVCEVVEA